MNEALDIRDFHESPNLKIWSYSGSSDQLVLSFSGIGSSPVAVQPYEFAKVATCNGKHSALFFSDKTRSWLNTQGLVEEIVDAIQEFSKQTPFVATHSLGHSMGGFMALAMPKFVPIQTALAFAPQFSVNPAVVPDETRWKEFTGRINKFLISDLEDVFTNTTKYSVIHGRHGREAPQRDIFPERSNLRRYILPKTHHNVPQILKRNSLLLPVFEASVAGRNRRIRLLLNTIGGYSK